MHRFIKTHVDKFLYNPYSKRVYAKFHDKPDNFFNGYFNSFQQQHLKLAIQSDYCEGVK